MNSQITLPTCSWCHRPIAPDEPAVSFPCPNCGKSTIWRCEICRELAHPYICPSCGFQGP
ncbi:MAG: zinc finger domain-containing protein [Aigarchaeota archaeon]|nr:zinc finger domain-containing protein [Candidatus Pelearchaeum maunauluense]